MTKPLGTSDKNELLYDLEDHVDNMNSDFILVGDGDIEKISSILGQSQNSNLIYVGKTGLGKTATIKGIAKRKIATIEGKLAEGENRLPLHMIDRRFMVLDVNTLFEENDSEKIQQNIKRIFSEMERPGDHVLIIEDANDWLKGIEDNQCQGMISMFVRELKKKSFQAILMVRDEPGKSNLKQVMDSHSEMAELFTIIEKKAPSKDEVLEIMKRTKPALETHHDGLHIDDDANAEIVNLTFLYPNLRIYMREQPSRSLRMRDQIASTFVSRMQSRPKELVQLKEKLADLEKKIAEGGTTDELDRQKVDLKGNIDTINKAWEKRASDLGKAYLEKRKHETDITELEEDHAARMKDLREKLTAEKGREPSETDINLSKDQNIKDVEKFLRETRKLLEAANEKAKSLKGENNEKLNLSVGDVREYFGEISGIPAKDLSGNEATKALDIDKRLKQKIYGQDEAVDVIAGAIKRAKAGLKSAQQPIGSFMLLGSSGIGKTYLAECLAEDLYDDASSLTTFDMSEFKSEHRVSLLLGAPPGYVGYGQGGALTNAVRNRPYQVILFDEVEKAHPDVFKILLQVLDKGRLTDELGTVDFRNTVIIMTTNLGQQMSFDVERTSENSEQELKGEAKKLFAQELINRVDSFLLLKAHTKENINRIMLRDLGTINKQLAEKQIAIELPQSDLTQLIDDKYRIEEGARQIQKFVKDKMTNKIADIVLENANQKNGGLIKAHYVPETNRFSLDFQPKGLVSAVPQPILQPPKPEIVPAALIAGGPSGVFQRAPLRATFAPAMM